MKRRLSTSGRLAAVLVLSGVCGAWAGDGVVALQAADPSCADPTNPDRYIDCGNGTVTDNDTGLVWLADASCLAAVSWFTAMEFVAGLSDLPGDNPNDCGLSDGSSPGEWRLPSRAEWQAMVAAAVPLGCDPTITDDAGTGCWSPPIVCGPNCGFTGVESSAYWSATTWVSDPARASATGLNSGSVGFVGKTFGGYVWPVRGGQ